MGYKYIFEKETIIDGVSGGCSTGWYKRDDIEGRHNIDKDGNIKK